MSLMLKLIRAVSLIIAACQILAAAPADTAWLNATALVVSHDGATLYICCATAEEIAFFDIASGRVTSTVSLGAQPSGLALSADGSRLYITCASPSSHVYMLDTVRRQVVRTLPAGHTAMAPVLTRDGRTLFVCNRFDNDVSVFDLAHKKQVKRITVEREPVAADVTTDGKYLLVANHLPKGRADANFLAAVVSVIDVATRLVIKEIQLPNGSGSLHDIRVSPDGKYAVVTHLVARYTRLPTRPTGGWMHGNAITIIDLAKMGVVHTVLLDDAYSGAGNPWGLAWSADSKTLVVTHAGTHEVSVIDFPGLIDRLSLPAPPDPVNGPDSTAADGQAGQEKYPSFFVGPRERIKLPDGDLGPRAAVVSGDKIYVANYFSDTITRIDFGKTPHPKAESIPLGPKREMNIVRKGEFYFHDADLCYQGWQSCSSCHPGDARVDGFNWDLLNDGIGNPKNTRSLLLAHKTPPSMSLGVRENAEAAVRAGIQHMLFTEQPEEVATAIDEYLKSLEPVPSPYLKEGQLSESAQRGKLLFTKAGCVGCHPPPLYTDLYSHDVGTCASFDKPSDRFYPPTLVELWRTAPYLHDGSAATVRDILTTCNHHDHHGKTSALSPGELDDLCNFLLSL